MSNKYLSIFSLKIGLILYFTVRISIHIFCICMLLFTDFLQLFVLISILIYVPLCLPSRLKMQKCVCSISTSSLLPLFADKLLSVLTCFRIHICYSCVKASTFSNFLLFLRVSDMKISFLILSKSNL